MRRQSGFVVACLTLTALCWDEFELCGSESRLTTGGLVDLNLQVGDTIHFVWYARKFCFGTGPVMKRHTGSRDEEKHDLWQVPAVLCPVHHHFVFETVFDFIV